MNNIYMYESPYSSMSKQMLFAFFLLAVVSMTTSGIILGVVHLHRRSFDVALVTTLEVVEVVMLLASPLVYVLYEKLQHRILAGLKEASRLSSVMTQATDIVSRWGYFKNVVNVITAIYVFTGVVVLPYLEVHFRYGSLSEFYQEGPSLYESGYLLGPIALSLVAYMVTVIITYRMIAIFAFVAKLSVSAVLVWWFISSDAWILVTIVYAAFALLSILHSLKKVCKWWSVKQFILFTSLLLTLSTTSVVIWAVLRPHVYHMYLSIMTLLALALVSVLLLFSAMKIVFMKSFATSWRKFGCLSQLWVLVPLIHFFANRDIAEEGVTTGVTIMFLPLLVETFVLLIRAVSCLLLERSNTTYEILSDWMRKLYVVRFVRHLSRFVACIGQWIVDVSRQIGRKLTRFFKYVVDFSRRMRQKFPRGAHSDSLLPPVLVVDGVDGDVC